ncbi:MAG: autotransporter-associated beta strand repeat-containing protein [Verrucomicrobia bacterium]|nr:autotransporter-associated beta strand repeat-containing protein [Verrucomicrobiota bacterium]
MVQDNTATTFAGAISGGNINFEKQGSNSLTLVSASNLGSGSFTVRGGSVVLRDSATMTTTGTISLPFGQVTLDNSGIGIVSSSRIGAGAFSMTGGTLSFLAGDISDTQTLGAITINGGANVINNTIFASGATSGSSSVLTLASLTRGSAVQSTINFTSAGGNLGGPVSTIVNASNTALLNQGANPQIVITSAPTLVNGIIGGWAVINGADFASYRSTVDPITGAFGVGNLGFSTNGQTPFGGYSANAITAGVAADNINTGGGVSDITARTINSWAVRNTAASAAASVLFRSMDQLLTIGTGGILTNNNGQQVNFLNGRMTAGTTANSTIYAFANNGTTQFLSRLENNGGGAVNFVKSGGATVAIRVEPRLSFASSTTGSSLVTTAGANSTGQTGVAGLVVGMGLNAGVVGIPASSIITQINSGTTLTVSQNVTTGTATAADTTFTAPTTEVLGNLNVTSGSATVTVPAGTVVYPGMVVSTAVGSTGTLAANTTVISVSGNTVTLSANATGTGSATLLFAPIATQGTIAVSNTSGTNTLSLTNATGLVVGQLVTGTGIPANSYITALSGTGAGATVTISANTTAAVTSLSATAPAERSIISATTSGSSTVKVLSSLGMFVGQPVQGPGVPSGTTVASIVDGTTITLSANASATGTANAYYGVSPAVGRTAIASVTSASNTITMASAAEAAGIVAGMYVQGVGIPQNTVVGSVSGNTVTLVSASTGAAANATASATSNNLIFGAPIANYVPSTTSTFTLAGTTAVTAGSTTGLAVGMPVFGTNIPNGTTIASITNGTSFVLSAAATGSGATSLTFTAPLPYFSNTYTGDTVVNQGTLQISNAASQLGGIQVPGNLILNNANATQITNNGSIAPTSNITINGGGVLTLVNQNTFQSLTFNNSGGSATPTVTGGTIVINGAITTTNDNYGFTPTIASILELNGVTKTITVNGSSPMGMIMSGVVQNTMSTTAAGLVKAGTSSLVLSGASTFAGGVQLNAGTLIIGAASTTSTAGAGITSGPLGTGILTIAGGTTLQSDNTARTFSNNVVVNGNFTFGGTASTHNLTLNGTVNLGGAARTLTVTSPQVTATMGGIVTGTAGGLLKVGDGTLTLTPTTTGALSATGAATNATVAGTTTLTLSATAAAGVVAGMTVHGTGIAPGTTVSSVAGSAVTLSQAAVATTNAGNFAFGTTQTYASTAGAAGATTLTVSTGQAATLSVGSTVTGVGIAASTTITNVDTATGIITLNNALTASVVNQNITFGGAAVANSFNSYVGATTVSGGLLKLGNLGALPTATALSVLSGGTLDLNANSTTVASLAGDSSTTGGLITNSATTGTATFTVGDSSSTGFGGAITNNVGSTLNLVKVGSGTLTLGGPNSYSGSTTINRGTITLAASNALPSSSAVTINNTTAGETGLLNLANFTNSIASLTFGGAGATSTSTNNVQTGTSGTLTLLGNVTYDATNNPNGSTISGSGFVSLGGTAVGTGLPGAANRTFAVGDSTATDDLTVNATISNGSGSAGDSITKTGAGKLVFTAANTYSGTNTISAGTLQIGNGSTTGDLGTGTGTITNNGALVVNRSNALTISNVITGTGSLQQAGGVSSVTTLTGASNYTGTTTVTSGTLELGAGGSLAGTAITVADAATLKITGNRTIGTSGSASVTVNSTATAGILSLQDGTINTLTLNSATAGATILTLGGASTAASLLMDINATANTKDLIAVNQRLLLNAGGTIVGLNTIAGTILANGTYDLVTFGANSTASGDFTFGAGTGNITFGAGGNLVQIGGGRSYGLVWDTGNASTAANFLATTTKLQLSVFTNPFALNAYWTGDQGSGGTGSWSSIGAGNNTNWSTDAAGTIDANQIPGGGTTNVFMTANSGAAANFTTTLDGSFSIASLTFTGSGTAADTTNVTIANGTGTNTLTVGSGGITVNSTSASHSISANVALGATQTWTNNSSGGLLVSGNVSGAFGLTKNGTGDLTLTGTNSYGSTTISTGALQIGNGTTTGTLGSGAVINNGTQLVISRSNDYNIANNISGTGDFVQAGGGTTTLSDTSNSYTGRTVISNSGTLEVKKLADGGSNSSIGASTNAAGNLQILGSTLKYTGTGATDGTTDRSFTIGTAGGTIDASGGTGSALNLTSTSAPALNGTNTTRTLTLTGTNTDANTLAAPVGDNGSGATSLAKNGTGTWILSGANTYTGATTVSNGQVHFAGSQTNTTAVTVSKNSGTLGTYSGATNTFTGQNAAVLSANDNVTLGSASGTVTVGGAGAVGILAPGGSLGANNGSLTIGHDLVVSSGSMLNLGITTPTVAAPTSFVFANGQYYLSSDTSFANGYSNVQNLITDNGNVTPPAANTAVATEINIAPASGNHDYINVAGTLTLSSGSMVHVFANGTPSFTYGEVFNLLDWTSIVNNGFNNPATFTTGGATGDFYLPDLSLTSSGLAWDTSAFTTYGILVVVPEPTRVLLLLFGLLGLAFRRRRSAR